MAIELKSAADIEKMRISGALAADLLEMIEPHVVPGVTTGELDRICHEYTVNKQGAIPAPLNYRGFPKSICKFDFPFAFPIILSIPIEWPFKKVKVT